MQTIKHNNFTLLHSHLPNEVANIRIFTESGSKHENADSFGTAHYLEHMFFKGTEKHNYNEINKILSMLGLPNAYTSSDVTCYHLSFLSEDFEKAADILFEMVFSPAFLPEEFEKEKTVILEEEKSYRDQPYSVFYHRYFESLYGTQLGHPTIGTAESIQATTLDKLIRFRQKNYCPKRIGVAVAGKITEDRFFNKVQQLLPNLSHVERPNIKTVLNLEDLHFTHISQQAHLRITAAGIPLSQELKRNHVPDVFNNGLGGGMHSLLFNKIRQELGLCYSVSSGHISGLGFGHQDIGVSLDAKNIKLAIDECKKLITKVKEEGFSDELLTISKRNYLFNFGSRCETSRGINGMADNYFALDGYPIDRYIDYAYRRKQVNSITNNDIIEFANEIYNDNKPLKITTMTHKG